MIRLYGKNRKRVAKGRRCYWTDIKKWRKQRKRLTGRQPLIVNVTSNSSLLDFQNLSPMKMGPVDCYRENGEVIVAPSVEVAWQYSKIYTHLKAPNGKLIDLNGRFLTIDAKGRPCPTQEWFYWRDSAFSNPVFNPSNPEFENHKADIRRGFPKGSLVAYWYWNGRLLTAIEARQKIYARLYCRFVTRRPGFKFLKKLSQAADLNIFDFDGYDWKELGLSPAACLADSNHSFGHGMVIAFLLQKIDPRALRILNTKGKII